MIKTALAIRSAARLLKGRGTQANQQDRDRARSVFIVDRGAGAPPTPLESSGVEQIVQFYLASPAFEHWTVSSAIAADRGALEDVLPSADLAWALRRLPLTDATRAQLKAKSNMTRGDLLEGLFADLEFLAQIYAARSYSWTAAVFLREVPTSQETLSFIQDLLADKSPIIDMNWLAQWGLSRETEASDLVRFAANPEFKANPLFDACWYAKRYQTGRVGYFDNLRHYVQQGERFGYSPNPFLNTRQYAEVHADLFAEMRAGRLSCFLQHLLSREAIEARSSASHFDNHFYSGQVSREASRRYGSGWGHYVNLGWREGRQPNPAFDQLWYLRTYPEALKAVAAGDYPNAFSHYVLEGETAGLHPNAFFDPKAYAKANADIAAAKTTTPFRHFWQQGRLEARDFGVPRTRPVVRYFQKRLPDSSDIVSGTGLLRLDTTPQAVLAQAAVSASSTHADLVSVLTGDAPKTAQVRAALAEALRQMGRPAVHVEVGREQQIHVGDVARMYVSGLASFVHLPLREIRANGETFSGQCDMFRYHRLEDVEVVVALGGHIDDLKGGFMTWFEFSADELEPGLHRVDLEFIFGQPGDDFTLVAHETLHVAVFARPRVSESTARVQVVMASYNPPAEPFRAQVDSILADPSVHLLISDDASPAKGAQSLGQYGGHPRVDIDINTQNGGFISNFERSLYMRSPSAEVLLFADQDDVWQADKVERLSQLLKPGVSCAFSDMRIVTGQGEVISPTFWTGRRVHYQDALSLGVANTITGAAAAFPAELADGLAPFPRYMGVYHDQWLAVWAAAVGRVEYDTQPLYDYVQHGGNVLGFAGSRSGNEARWGFIARKLRRALKRGAADARDLAYVEVALAETIPLLQRFVLLNEALERAPKWADQEVRRLGATVAAAIRGEAYDPVFLTRAWGRLARRSGGAEGLLNIDDLFASILLARALIDTGVVAPDSLKLAREAAADCGRRHSARLNDPNSNFFESKIAPIRLASGSSVGAGDLRINMFLPELQLGTFFGGYHSKISLITRLAERGVRTRLVLVDQAQVDHDQVARIIGAFPELELGLAQSEIVAMGSRHEPLDIGPCDVLLATTWWSAYIVDDLRKHLGRERFTYFIQEYEPFTFPLGTWYRAAEATYDFPHDALFSTEILENYFSSIRAGVFGLSAVRGARSLPFRNPITGLKGMARMPVGERRRRLLFYARPQVHAARNMFEFGLSALRLAVQRLGDELDGWDLVGVGANENSTIKLDGDRSLRMISKLDSYGYRQMLASSDVGLALMYTPHPSLVPLEMAAAGMLTVTNACMSKGKDAFADVSSLIHVAEPDVEAIAEALIMAFRDVNAGEVEAGDLEWPVTPAGAFPESWLDQFLVIVKGSCAKGRGL